MGNLGAVQTSRDFVSWEVNQLAVQTSRDFVSWEVTQSGYRNHPRGVIKLIITIKMPCSSSRLIVLIPTITLSISWFCTIYLKLILFWYNPMLSQYVHTIWAVTISLLPCVSLFPSQVHLFILFSFISSSLSVGFLLPNEYNPFPLKKNARLLIHWWIYFHVISFMRRRAEGNFFPVSYPSFLYPDDFTICKFVEAS